MPIRRERPGLELIDILDRVLDKGVTVEASALLRISGNELRRMSVHIVVESVETYKGDDRHNQSCREGRAKPAILAPRFR